jgi:calcium-dependent protein kinase
LINKKGKINEPDASRIFHQILSATYYCHKNNILHRDIKAENVIFENKSKES